MKVICQYCHKEINPIAISDWEARGGTKTKYHEGCKRKAAAARKRGRKEVER